MYIIGTAGHVDHGKSLLIKTLTGIDPDRLPEEKERKLTIDLGFAHIDYPDFGNVGIIDVPGHERFIKNMVKGAWGIDLALLVIAADDGWMPQTEDHLRVLQLLNISSIIVALTKIDLIDEDEELIQLHCDAISSNLNKAGYDNSKIFPVSSVKNKGIDALKDGILEEIKKLSVKVYEKPYIFIDRVFSIKGSGTVITGTLKNGNVNKDENLILLPGEIKTRIKKIQNFNRESDKAFTNQRTALNLSSVDISQIERGAILAKENFFVKSDIIIAAIKFFKEDIKLNRNIELELIVGTKTVKGIFTFIVPDNSESYQKIFARVKLSDPWYFYYGERFIITYPGHHSIIGGGIITAHTNLAGKKVSSIKKILTQSQVPDWQNISLKEIILFNILMAGSLLLKQKTDANQLLFSTIESDSDVMDIVSELSKTGKFYFQDDLIITYEKISFLKDAIINLLDKKDGLSTDEIAGKLDEQKEVISQICEMLAFDKKVNLKNNMLFIPGKKELIAGSLEYKNIINELKGAADKGIEIKKIDNPKTKKQVSELIRYQIAVSLDGNIVYHMDTYEVFKAKIMAFYTDNKELSLTDAKNLTGLTRKYIIPLLNKLESDGLIKRAGEVRIKAE